MKCHVEYRLIGVTRKGNKKILAIFTSRQSAAGAFASVSRRGYKSMSLVASKIHAFKLPQELMRWDAPVRSGVK